MATIPAILAKEIYALAALVAAVTQVVGQVSGWWSIGLTSCLAASVCVVIRFLALRYSWGLSVVRQR